MLLAAQKIQLKQLAHPAAPKQSKGLAKRYIASVSNGIAPKAKPCTATRRVGAKRATRYLACVSNDLCSEILVPNFFLNSALARS